MEEPTLGQPDPEPTTRPPMPFWDRVKFLLLFFAVWFVLVWNFYLENRIVGATLGDAIYEQGRAGSIWIVLFGIELVRQIHYLLSEHWSGWHRFWSQKVFGSVNRRLARLNDWNRYRLARVLKVMAAIALIGYVLGQVYDQPPTQALFELPATIWAALPMLLQVVFVMAIAVLQFVAIFWFLSRGGVETYMPNDIKTRFSDVWGQDNVLARIKENLLYLDSPETIEEKGGYVPGGILLWGPPGTGKGQPVSALVMTPSGPKRMGDIVPGDQVIGSDGRAIRVDEVHLLGVRDLYEVGFSDGTSLLVTEDHLWQVTSRYGGTKVKDTKSLIDNLVEADGHARYRIPMVRPVEFQTSTTDLPLAPYLLGALLGDGTFRHHLGISSADIEILARVEALLPEGDGLVRKSTYDWSIIGGATRTAVKELELFGRYSHEKHLPDEYKWLPAEDRLELLRGLMDTDGHVDTRGVVEFHTTSPALADGVVHLVESFGGTCTRSTRETRYRHNGAELRGRPVTVLRLALPPDIVPFHLQRKVDRYRPRTKYLPQRRMVSITPAGREEARCLRVDAPDHLYVTERFIVTHNTLMAEAVAGETGKPFVFVDPGAFTNMFMGVGILKVKSLFRKLRKLAVRYGGVVVFFDEADSLGNRGALAQGGWNGGMKTHQPAWTSLTACNGLSYLSEASSNLALRGALPSNADVPTRDGIVMGMGGGGGMGTLQALLTELSGMKKPRGFINRFVRRALGMRPKPPPKYRMLIMMATNMPESLDEAMLRPGRIDRIYKVGYPSKAGRIRTYEGYLAKVSHQLTPEEIDKLATITPYATGATIKDMVNEALITAIRDGRETIEWKDIIRAKQLKDLGLPEDVEYIDRERHATAVHEACHAVIAYRVRRHLTIDIATIEKGGNYLGMVASIPPEDLFTRWRSEYEADILVSLASLAGERMFFDGDNSSGVSGDLESATQIASLMEGYWGMGRTIASHGVTHRIGIGGGGGPGDGPPGAKKQKDLLASQLGHRIEAKLAELYEQAEALLRENRLEVLSVAHALETHKTLTGDDVAAIIDGVEGPLIDGRVYRQKGFREAAEEYHRLAVEAHQTHERVGSSLPVLVAGAFDPRDRGSSNGTGTGNGHSNGNGSDGNGEPTRRRRRTAASPKDEA